MSGKIKRLLNIIINERSNGNPAIEETTKAKIILKGINPNDYDSNSEDDPIIIEQLYTIASQLNLNNISDAKENIRTIYSTHQTEEDVVNDFKHQLEEFNIKVLIYFFSPSYDIKLLTKLMKAAFNDVALFGCSSAGEITSGQIMKSLNLIIYQLPMHMQKQ